MEKQTKIIELENYLSNKLFSNKTIEIDRDTYLMYEELFLIYSEFNNMEYLKRVIFMQWYISAENYQFNDCITLDNEIEKKNLYKVLEAFNENELDDEFLVMLKHYFTICDWYFNSFDLKGNLNHLFNNKISLSKIDFNNRGIMGEYWKEIR